MLSFCLETIFEGHGVRIFGATLFATYCYSKICYLLHDILHVFIKYSHASKKEFGSFSKPAKNYFGRSRHFRSIAYKLNVSGN